TKPIRVIVNSAPGGLTDVIGRLVATRMSQSLGQAMPIDNRIGAGGLVGAEAVVKAEADGYTIGVVASAITVGPQLLPNPPFDAARDLTPVALLMSTPLVLVTNVNSPYQTVAQFVADARARPGQISIASGGNATMTHLLAEQFQMHAGLRLIHVPYKGGAPALNDVLAGHVPVYFDTLTTSAAHVQAGKLRGLAIVSPKRSPAIPAVPTLAEAGFPEVQGMAWFAIVGPAGMRREVVARLNEEAVKALATAEIRDRIVALGGTVEGGTPADLAELIRSEMPRWARLIRERGIKAQ
ncbi:MAG: tripartite tricarboxylate transporter substrate binding protein, partial [Burkholderiales bacterium]|nr:tripartite tricarboxylate transporter substrate binding protein [Burkholderiales bacterium]